MTLRLLLLSLVTFAASASFAECAYFRDTSGNGEWRCVSDSSSDSSCAYRWDYNKGSYELLCK